MNSNEKNLLEQVKGERILFITTKNIDYIRNTQEVRLLEENSKSVEVLHSTKKNYVGRIMELWIRLLFMNLREIDIIFIGFAPQLILPFFKWKMRNKTVIIDFFISIYDTMVHDRKKFKDKGVIAKLCYYIDYVTLRWADYVIADTKAHARYFVDEFKSEQSKFEILYLEADKTIYYPREQHKKEELKNKFVVLYFGSILPLQGVEVILEAIKKMEDAKDIAETLMNNCTVILNLEGLDVEIAQRIIDFTCGACYSLGGSLQKISGYIYILTPAGVDISGDFQEILNGSLGATSMKSNY